MRKRIEKRLVDKMVYAYVGWREACLSVNDAYCAWANATGAGAGIAFGRYTVALELEELAAEVYAGLVHRVARLVASDHDRGSRAWGALRP